MSDAIFDDPEFENDLPQSESELEPETVGQTSDEQPDEADPTNQSATETEVESSKKKFELSLFDAMLLISLLCVTVATLLLVLELRRIDSSFPLSFPWRTSEVLNVLIYK